MLASSRILFYPFAMASSGFPRRIPMAACRLKADHLCDVSSNEAPPSFPVVIPKVPDSAVGDGIKKPRVLIISGPTAVGKSRIALEVAKKINGEIIGADSVQVYQGLDVGSAKTPLNDRQGIPHHLIDVVKPNEDYDAADYYRDSREATENVLARKHVPIVVGGAGLYLRWYVYGKANTPESTPEIKSLVEAELLELLQNGGGWDDAVKRLREAGDDSASETISRNDWYRLRRGFEIIKAKGLPRSAYPLSSSVLRKQQETGLSVGLPDSWISPDEHGGMPRLDYDFLGFFLFIPRVKLYQCIDLRCEMMLTGTMGLLKESSCLLDLGILPNTNSVSRAIGYRQAMEYLTECRKAGGTSSEEHFFSFLSEFQKASRRYAKRQLTWFRKEPLHHWIDASEPLEYIVDLIINAYKDPATVERLDELRLKELNQKEGKLLKAYKTQNRYFIKREDCAPILEWVRETQTSK